MPDELPPAAPDSETPPLQDEEDDDVLFAQPQAPPWRRWVIFGLIAAVLLAIAAVGVMLYVATKALQRQLKQQPNYGFAPATAKGQGPFDEVTRLKTQWYVQAIGGGDVDGDKAAEAIVWAGEQVTLYDQTGHEESAFPSHLSAINAPPMIGSWMPLPPGGGVRRPLVATIKGKPAIVLTDGESESVFAYRADGERILNNKVQYSHARCLAVADLNGDGEDEILVGRSSAVGLVCVDGSGKTKWKHGAATDPSWICVGDGNGDSKPEVFVGYDTSVPQILDADGKHVGDWAQWRLIENAQCADLDGDGKVEFLLSVSQTPGGRGSGGSSGSGGASSLGFGRELDGVGPDGMLVWDVPLNFGQPWVSTTHLASGDLNGDGKGEWVASAPDGTVRLYDVAGNEIGRYAFGSEVQTLGVVGGGKRGERPQLWVSLGKELVVLKWR
jgi:hypothetical protein